MTDTSENLKKTRAALAALHRRIAQLKADRADKLAGNDDVSVVRGIDAEIQEAQRDVGIYQERLGSLEEALHLERIAVLEAERTRACDNEISEFCKQIVARGRSLQRHIKGVEDDYFAISVDIPRAIKDRWPRVQLRPDWNTFEPGKFAGEVGAALYEAGRPTSLGGSRLPAAVPLPAVAGMQGVGIAEFCERLAASLLHSLRTAPLIEPPPTVVIDEEAAA